MQKFYTPTVFKVVSPALVENRPTDVSNHGLKIWNKCFQSQEIPLQKF